MKMATIIKLAVVLSAAFGVAGCAGNVASLTSAEVEKQIRVETVPDHSRIWTAPELQTRRFRTLFYGYDTVYYRLNAIKPDSSSGNIVYRLLFDANYGGAIRHYELAKTTAGVSYPANHRRHETERCQFFSNMVSACLYRDRADVALGFAELSAGRQSGLTLILGSPDSDYERIELPAQYVDGFLQAVQKNP